MPNLEKWENCFFEFSSVFNFKNVKGEIICIYFLKNLDFKFGLVLKSLHITSNYLRKIYEKSIFLIIWWFC